LCVGLYLRQSGCGDESGEDQNPLYVLRPSQGECFFCFLSRDTSRG